MGKTSHVRYNPVSDEETGSKDALSVRAVRDHIWNINNYRFHAGSHKSFGAMFYPPIESLDTNDSEDLLLYVCRIWIPPCYKHVRWWIQGKAHTGAETVWKLYSSPTFYVGPQEAWDSTLLSHVVSGSLTIDDPAGVRVTGTIQLGISAHDGYRWFYLTATNDDTSRCNVVSLDVQPYADD